MGSAVIDPALALQTALRSHLIAAPAVTALVEPASVRDGAMRPDELPAILFGAGNVIMHGRASGSQFVATVFLDLHVWAIEDGLDRAKTIGAAVALTLMDWPAGDGFAFDAFKHTRTIWPRDPKPEFGHGVLSIEAVVRWSI